MALLITVFNMPLVMEIGARMASKIPIFGANAHPNSEIARITLARPEAGSRETAWLNAPG